MADFDKIFNEIGNFGKYQAFLIFVCIWSMIPIAANISAVIFLGFQEPYRCALPESRGNQTLPSNDSTSNRYQFNSRDLDECSMLIYTNSSCNDTTLLQVIQNKVELNQTVSVVPCVNGYHYDNQFFTQTIRTEWDLVCEHSRFNALATSLFCLGTLLGSLFGGSLADRYGRKSMMVIGTVLNVALGVACSFSPNFFAFASLRLFVGVFAVVVQIAMATYTVEIVGKRYRSWVGLLVGVYSGLGYMALSAIAFFIRDWRTLQLVLGLIFIPFLLFAPVVPESPRLLVTHGNFKKARQICERIARWNGRYLTEDTWNNIVKDKEICNACHSRGSYTLVKIVKNSTLASLLLMNIILWFVNGFIFFCLSFNVGHWFGNPFLNNALSGLVEAIACVLIVPVINKFGRRNTIMAALAIAGLAIVIDEILRQSGGAQVAKVSSVTLLLIAKFTISGSFNLLFLYTAEMFPTETRNTALGISTIGGRAASIVAAFAIELQHTATWILSLLLASIAFGSILMTWKFPETKGMKMFSTIKEADDFYKKRKSKTLLNNNVDDFASPNSEVKTASDSLISESSL